MHDRLAERRGVEEAAIKVMLSWSWLRIGRRIEWVATAVFLFGALLFGALGLRLSSYDFFVAMIYLCLGGINTFILELPVVFLLVRRRKWEALVKPAESRKKLGRPSLYLLLFALTLVSATVQVKHGMISLAGSSLAVYLWNLGLFAIVIAWNEVSIWLRGRR